MNGIFTQFFPCEIIYQVEWRNEITFGNSKRTRVTKGEESEGENQACLGSSERRKGVFYRSIRGLEARLKILSLWRNLAKIA
jgi:hypothetical protein